MVTSFPVLQDIEEILQDARHELPQCMTIFICGVHGSGKTTFCTELSRYTAIPNFSSSELIKEEKIGDEFLKTKRVKNINRNQEALINAVHKKITFHQKIILDGHTTLLNSQGEIICIEPEVFSKLHVHILFLLEVSAEIIQKRLSNRDGFTHSLGSIQRHIEREREQTYRVAKSLGIAVRMVFPECTGLENDG